MGMLDENDGWEFLVGMVDKNDWHHMGMVEGRLVGTEQEC